MKSLSLVLSVCVCLVWANEDVLRDLLLNEVNGDEVEKRAVLNAVGAAALKDAALNMANNIGWSKSLNRGVSKSFEDSCMETGLNGVPKINVFPGGLPVRGGINSFNNNLLSSLVSSKGKREVKERLANRDIVFVLDSSGSIPDDEFEKAKRAINILLESYCPSTFGNEVTKEGTKQISVVVFDSTVTTEVDFSESSKGLGYLQDKIMSIRHRKGSTATGSALSYVKNSVLGKGQSRLSDPKVSTDVIVITDGQCNVNCCVLGSEANAIRKMGHGVNLSALGVAKARACELEVITGKGDSDMAYGLGDFRNFNRFATAIKEIAQENESKCV